MLEKTPPEGLTYDDVLLLPAYSEVLASECVTATRLTGRINLPIPLLSAAMDSVTEANAAMVMAQQGGLGIIHKNLTPAMQADQVALVKAASCEGHPLAALDPEGRLCVGASVGVGDEELRRATALVAAGADILCVDTAHGHSRRVLDMVKALRAALPPMALMAGNVATAEGALALIEAGANCIKVGLGPGSICTTRVVAGVGVPQVTAVAECAAVARHRGVTIIADGGIKHSGDITKAIAAGAHAVMIGSMLAGTDESPGEMVLIEGRRYKAYRGMGSLAAMRRGSAGRYGQAVSPEDLTDTGELTGKLVPEGIEGLVPHKGPLAGVLYQLLGGLRSGMGYTGCATIEELREKGRFIRITPQGLRESHVHDVIIAREAPNYLNKG